MRKFWHFFFNLGTVFHDSQVRAWKKTVSSYNGDDDNKESFVSVKAKDLGIVKSMFTRMKMTVPEIDAIMNVICNPNCYSGEEDVHAVLDDLVTLYEQYMLLEPFGNAQNHSILPFRNASKVLRANIDEKYLCFMNAARRLLPMSPNVEDLEDALTDTLAQMSQSQFKANLMSASGYTPRINEPSLASVVVKQSESSSEWEGVDDCHFPSPPTELPTVHYEQETASRTRACRPETC